MATDSLAKSAVTGRVLAVAIMTAVAAYLTTKGIDLTEEHRAIGVDLLMAAGGCIVATVPVLMSKWRSIKKTRAKKGGG